MVVGIAGGLDPALPVGALMVPEPGPSLPRRAAATAPTRSPHGQAEGDLMTTDGLLSDEEVWRPILESGFGAVDMEAAGVAEACERAGVDWSVYRGISDRPDENIVDQAVFALSKPDGSADLRGRRPYLARDPRRAKTLAHLNRCMGQAAHVAATAAFDDLRHQSADLVGNLASLVLVVGRSGPPVSLGQAGDDVHVDRTRRTPCAGSAGSPSRGSSDCQRESFDVPSTICVI